MVRYVFPCSLTEHWNEDTLGIVAFWKCFGGNKLLQIPMNPKLETRRRKRRVMILELNQETMETIDRLITEADSNLMEVLNRIMPMRDGNLHWTVLTAIGLFSRNYTAAREQHNMEIQEAISHAVNVLMENEEIQSTLAKMVRDGFHAFAMGGF